MLAIRCYAKFGSSGTGCGAALFFDLPAAAVEERVRKTGGDGAAVADGAASFAAAIAAEVHAMESFDVHGRGFTIDATAGPDAMLRQTVEALVRHFPAHFPPF